MDPTQSLNLANITSYMISGSLLQALLQSIQGQFLKHIIALLHFFFLLRKERHYFGLQFEDIHVTVHGREGIAARAGGPHTDHVS